MVMLVFQVQKTHERVGRYRCLGGTYHLHLQGCTSATQRYNPEDQHWQYYYIWITNPLPWKTKYNTNTIISFHTVSDCFIIIFFLANHSHTIQYAMWMLQTEQKYLQFIWINLKVVNWNMETGSSSRNKVHSFAKYCILKTRTYITQSLNTDAISIILSAIK